MVIFYLVVTRWAKTRLKYRVTDECYTYCLNSEANWAQRMANHCRYFANEKLQGAEIYDMWLRISAGIGGDPFEYFLCHGEGVFADCLTNVSV